MSLDITEKILTLTRQLYPTGRAWKMPFQGDLEKLHRGLAVGENQFYKDCVSILNSQLPDNDDFDEDDAALWEERLGLITNEAVNLADRKAAIQRKWAYPGRNPAKSHFKYIEDQLQKAGFDVYVYENIFPTYPTGYESVSPVTINSDIFSEYQHGDRQHGDIQHGGYVNNICVNHIEEIRDIEFLVGNSFRCSFFIGGAPLGTYADAPAIRKDEFRQIILKTKQVQDVAFLFINYT